MNKFAKMLITEDKRNPYGSRGGYVRDREDSHDYNDMRKDYERMRKDYEDMRRDYERMRDSRDMDYRRDRDEDYRKRDYGEPELFKKKDIETWKSLMKNEDGTRGAHFHLDQVKRAAEKAGIDIEEFGEDVFCLAMNMEYSDKQKVAKKYGVDIPEYYADAAKAFLRDKDFEGKPEEKLYLYYKTIVEKDD